MGFCKVKLIERWIKRLSEPSVMIWHQTLPRNEIDSGYHIRAPRHQAQPKDRFQDLKTLVI
ncbi:MAG: hypothetical protein KME30_23250 [Iphinoe sp. HA4291-MV1]|nr:hypothetical protein [Iphinoe sp. HA4291-MV1]